MIMLVLATSCGNAGKLPKKALSLPEARELRTQILDGWKAEKAAILTANENAACVTNGTDTMKYAYTVFGDEPEGGHSLWISLHGGGATAHEFNDGQWDNQKRLYQPAEGIYLSPRAPWDAWNMWFQEPIDALFGELIQTMVTVKGVNPDKIYLLGYSAGGDGVWRLAPRLADFWASASMMAGHPGDVSLVNVRNLPFLIWVGGNDDAYNRNKEVAARGAVLDSLQAADPEGYIHECHVVEGMGHWMKLTDAAALPWMAQYTRNPYPKRIVWQQEEVTKPSFYWISAPADEIRRGMKAVVEVDGNTITIEQSDYTSLTLLLNDAIVDLDKPVTVLKDGRTLYKGLLERKAETLKETLYERGDPRYMFDCRLTVSLAR